MALPSAVTLPDSTSGRIGSPLHAAAALDEVARLEWGQRLTAEQLHKLLYYVQGVSFAQDGTGMFEGRFVGAAQGPVLVELASFVAEEPRDWWHRLRQLAPAYDLDGWERIREVCSTFGRLTAFELTQASKAERPWLKARDGRAWYDKSEPEIADRDIKIHFAEMLELGEDAVSDLGLNPTPGQPSWVAPFKVAVNLKFLAGHPFFHEAEARDLRARLGFTEVPEDWSQVDFSAKENIGPDETLRH